VKLFSRPSSLLVKSHPGSTRYPLEKPLDPSQSPRSIAVKVCLTCFTVLLVSVIPKRVTPFRPQVVNNNSKTKPREQLNTSTMNRRITPGLHLNNKLCSYKISVGTPVQKSSDEPVPLEAVNFITTTHMGAEGKQNKIVSLPGTCLLTEKSVYVFRDCY
jgi:hypothetical protein